MKIEAGKKYITRDGKIAIASIVSWSDKLVRLDRESNDEFKYFWHIYKDGSEFSNVGSEYDLIAEVLDPIEKLERFLESK